METSVEKIPDNLIYEMVDGQPIYYRGYQAYLRGEVQMEEIMGSSYLQSLIITRLVFFLLTNLGDRYTVLTNEIGLQFPDKGWRAADIAIIERERLQGVAKTNKYLQVPPKVVVEIDTKAELSEAKDSFGYFHKKTDELLAFGVQKVVWIFTDSEKIMVAEKDKDWQILSWSREMEIFEGLTITLTELVAEIP